MKLLMLPDAMQRELLLNPVLFPSILLMFLEQRAKPFVQTFCLKNNEFYAAILLMIAEGKLPSLYTSSGVL